MNSEEMTFGVLILIMLLALSILIGLCTQKYIVESESKSQCIMKGDVKLCIDYYITKDWYVETGSKMTGHEFEVKLNKEN